MSRFRLILVLGKQINGFVESFPSTQFQTRSAVLDLRSVTIGWTMLLMNMRYETYEVNIAHFSSLCMKLT